MAQTYANIRSKLLPPNLPAALLPPSRPAYPELTASIAALSLHPCLEALLHLLNRDLASAHFLVRHMESIVPPGDRVNVDTESVWRQPVPKRPEAAEWPPEEANGQEVAGDECESESDGLVSGTRPPPATDLRDGLAGEPPKIESMLLHGILHRIEGDYENARLWYRDVLKYCAPYPGETVLSVAWPPRIAPSPPSSESAQADHARTGSWSTNGDGFPLEPSNFLDRIRNLQRGRSRYEGKDPGLGNGQAASSDTGDAPKNTVSTNDDRAEIRQWHTQYAELERESERELTAVLTWLEMRYGTKTWKEASSEFVAKNESSDAANAMIVGGEGWRQF